METCMQTDGIRRKRRRKPGDIASLRRTLWAALLEIEDMLGNDDPALKLRAAHALATLSGVYLKTIELDDVAARLTALEAGMPAPTGGLHALRQPA
jgi:hypothetical protein